MKVTVKETGEVLEIIDLYDDGTAEATNGEYYKVSDLHFYFNAIDWEQRRYEIAKDVMAGIISNEEQAAYARVEAKYEKGEIHTIPKAISRYAIALADGLIEELRLR